MREAGSSTAPTTGSPGEANGPGAGWDGATTDGADVKRAPPSMAKFCVMFGPADNNKPGQDLVRDGTGRHRRRRVLRRLLGAGASVALIPCVLWVAGVRGDDGLQSAQGSTKSEQGLPVQPSAQPAFVSLWRSLENDGIHDPTNPALSLLQQPAEALSTLPAAPEGNLVDWVSALRMGYIEPRTNVFPETKVNIRDTEVLMENTANMPIVRFSHRAHTEWLDCSNCHDAIFVAKENANPITMLKILDGQYCGQCHGAVAFPLTECARCHSVDRPSSDAEKN